MCWAAWAEFRAAGGGGCPGWTAPIVEGWLPGSSSAASLSHPSCNERWSVSMPELPDIIVYVDALRQRIVGHVIESIRIVSPFVPRSVEPPIEEAGGKKVCDVARLGKRVVVCLADDLFLVFHLMIAGRFQWKRQGSRPPDKITLATFLFSNDTLVFSEAGKKKRAALHLIRGEEMLVDHDPRGPEVLNADEAAFRGVLCGENHTLKRVLTDPRLMSGVGNAYSDEIHLRRHLSFLVSCACQVFLSTRSLSLKFILHSQTAIAIHFEASTWRKYLSLGGSRRSIGDRSRIGIRTRPADESPCAIESDKRGSHSRRHRSNGIVNNRHSWRANKSLNIQRSLHCNRLCNSGFIRLPRGAKSMPR